LTSKQHEFEHDVKLDVEARVRQGVKAVLEEVLQEEMTEHLEAGYRELTPTPGAASLGRTLHQEPPHSRRQDRDRGRPDLSMATREARIRTTNMLEGLFKEVKRRTRVVGVFPNETSAATLAMEEIALRSSEESGR